MMESGNSGEILPAFSNFSGTFKDNYNKFSGTCELCEDDQLEKIFRSNVH
jgi:hypothetical protein